MKIMKKNPVTLLFAALTSLAPLHAGEFVDNFDRQDVAATADGAEIGTGWMIGSGEWALIRNRLRVNTNFEAMALNSVMWNTEIGLQNGDFTVSLTRFRVTNPRTCGLAFLIQDADSYRAFRIGGISGENTEWELIENDGGAVTVLQVGQAAAPFNSETPYEITVTSSKKDTLTFKVTDLNTSETVVDTTITQPGLPDTGFAGPYYFQDSGQYLFDDFAAASPVTTR